MLSELISTADLTHYVCINLPVKSDDQSHGIALICDTNVFGWYLTGAYSSEFWWSNGADYVRAMLWSNGDTLVSFQTRIREVRLKIALRWIENRNPNDTDGIIFSALIQLRCNLTSLPQLWSARLA